MVRCPLRDLPALQEFVALIGAEPDKVQWIHRAPHGEPRYQQGQRISSFRYVQELIRDLDGDMVVGLVLGKNGWGLTGYWTAV